ncbi:MAG: nucleotide pyrophosphatase, partial [Porphyromonas sp.]|nr:nucleotide pyrophosphatase [Porphyromonas sp.]
TYLRLDAELKRLFEALDKRLGLHNCLITLSGTGYTGYTSYKDSKSERLKRSVSVARLTALINMYLTAQHGPGEWISHNANGRLYLNHKLVESKRLSLESLQSDIADFLSAAEGIGRTVPAHELASSGDDYVRRLARATVARYRADVYWSVLPGWQVEDLASNPQLSPVSTAIPTPFIIMGQGMERSTTPLPRIEVRDIVRIICSYLRIRPPND